ncbi:MAG: MFS transporter, partial [Dehalococcoidia bacterium]
MALVLAIVLTALTSVFFPASPASAAEECLPEEWEKDWRRCAEQLPPANDACLDPPIPSAPNSGLAGWFSPEPTRAARQAHNPGLYIDYGYGGYDFHTYGLRCGAAGADPGIATENMIANWELKLASGIVGASNALREKAWDPGSLWTWADNLLQRVTKSIYDKVFTTFGAITLTIVGLYLIWRSRQADMNDSMTTAGWAVLVMLVVTAVAVYPVWAANLADGMLTQSLDVVHEAAGPRPERLTRQNCAAGSCEDPRPPAERASEIATESVLYRNWLRGALGSSDSEVAEKYGVALYDAQAFSWKELQRIENTEPEKRQAVRDSIIKAKQDRFNRIAEQIKREDPEAYEHLQGRHGADRIGAGFIALLSAVFFGFFDIVASMLILLSFMIFRWAVIAAPLLGTVALLRPASGGLRRMGNAVVAGIFNIVIFGAGAAIYL